MPDDPAQGSGSGGSEVPLHPLAPRVTAEENAAAVEGYETIVGFVGDSPRDGYVRVYASLSFRTFCEVRKSDIALSALLDADDPEGPTVLRVSAGARIEFLRSSRLEGEASYVLGTIRSANVGLAQRASAEADYGLKVMPLDPVSVVYPPCGPPPPPPPITPVLYCLSEVYPPC